MVNTFFGLGRLVAQPEVKESENGNKYMNMTVAVQRSYKNADGVYDTDFLDVVCFGPVAQTTAEYCQKGDMLGIRGRVETSLYENEDGEKRKSTQIVADRITFVSSKSKEQDEFVKSEDDLDM